MNPSPYMYYYDLGDHHVVGHRRDFGPPRTGAYRAKITIRRWRAPSARVTPEADLAAEQTYSRPKERAEHVMLIDLARNDNWSHRANRQRQGDGVVRVERYSHVMHIVSNVEGICEMAYPAWMCCVPASLPYVEWSTQNSGYGGYRSTRTHQTGIYGGACGYLSYAGDMDVAIAIRTAVVKDKPFMSKRLLAWWLIRCLPLSGRNRAQGTCHFARGRAG